MPSVHSRPARSTPAGHWLRLAATIGQGLVTSGAAAVAHEHHSISAAVRARQIRPRRVAVIGSAGGAGTTSVAVLLASVLAASRDDQTMVLTRHADGCDAATRLALPHAPAVTDVLAGLRRQGQIPPSPVTGTGLRVLGAPPPGQCCPDDGLSALLDAAACGHACVVVDAGVACQIPDLATLGELVDTVLLVCPDIPTAEPAAVAVIERFRARATGDPAGARLLLVPVGSRPRTGTDPAPSTRSLRGTGIGQHAMPYDASLARGTTISLDGVSGPVLTSVLRLAADIVGSR